jgi:hypothetical protein
MILLCDLFFDLVKHLVVSILFTSAFECSNHFLLDSFDVFGKRFGFSVLLQVF